MQPLRWRRHPVPDAIGVDEVEPRTLNASENNTDPGIDVDGVPAHVRQRAGIEPLDHSGPLPQAIGLHPMFDAAVEEHLHTDADAENRPPTGQPAVLRPGHRAPIAVQRHTRQTPRHRGTTRPSASAAVGTVRCQGHLGSYALQRSHSRSNVARAVMSTTTLGPLACRCDDPAHRLPFVEGTPPSRGSNATASRSARATALNCASAM